MSSAGHLRRAPYRQDMTFLLSFLFGLGWRLAAAWFVFAAAWVLTSPLLAFAAVIVFLAFANRRTHPRG